MERDALPTRNGRVTRREPVSVLLDEDTGIVRVSVHGRWSDEVRAPAQRTVGDALAAHPAGLLLDLRGLDDPDAASAQLWLSTAAQAAETRPVVPVVACPAGDTPLAGKLTAMGPRRRLTVSPTPAQAHAVLVSRRPLIDQLRLPLPPRLSVVGAARDLITAACRQWDMPTVRDRGRVVASELVANAVEHAGTDIILFVSRYEPALPASARRHSRLRLAVHDHVPLTASFPRPPVQPAAPISERGYGLHIIARASEAWGTLPTTAGKAVWAILHA